MRRSLVPTLDKLVNRSFKTMGLLLPNGVAGIRDFMEFALGQSLGVSCAGFRRGLVVLTANNQGWAMDVLKTMGLIKVGEGAGC